MQIHFIPYDQTFVDALRAGGTDAYGLKAEHTVSDGAGNPCRSCLCNIPKGAAMLICAGRPFGGVQPYAETGPIFLCGDACTPWSGTRVPAVLTTSPDYLLKAYSAEERIIYGTGQITLAGDISAVAAGLLERSDVAFVDVRSARNNCFQTRVKRVSG
jgi:hypothetical protein